MIEEIPDEDDTSRLMFEPAMRGLDNEIIWHNVFMFRTEDNFCESVVWRRYAASADDVNMFGCAKQHGDRAKGKLRSTYFGYITGNVAAIRSLKSAKGIHLAVIHAPEEGRHHAHITFQAGSTKNDRNELKYLLRTTFGELAPHTCT